MKLSIILCGCGHLDGSEIRESILLLLAIEKFGIEYEIFAPDIKQLHVLNYMNGKIVEGEDRNVLLESAKIARGSIKDLNQLNTKLFDGMVIPGGFGTAKNLSDIAYNTGTDITIIKEVKNCIIDFYNNKKPIGGICFAPVLIAHAIKSIIRNKCKMTLGNNGDIIEKLGFIHEICDTKNCVYDIDNAIITSPAYMHDDTNLYEISQGIENLVKCMYDFHINNS